MDNKQAIKHLFQADLFGCAMNKLFRKNLFDEDSLSNTYRINEDYYEIFNLMVKAERVVYVQDKLYFYRQRSNSVSHASYSLKWLDCILVHEKICDYVHSHIELADLGDLAVSRYLGALLSNYAGCRKKYRVHKKQIVRKIKNNFRFF